MMSVHDIGFDRLIAIVAAMVTIVASAVALFQSWRYRGVQKNLKQLKREIKNRLWGDIHLTLQIFDSLEEARMAYQKKNNDIPVQIEMKDYMYHKILSARKCAVASYLRQLEQRINEEEYFDRDMAMQWYKDGILQNEWRKNAALQFADVRRQKHPLISRKGP